MSRNMAVVTGLVLSIISAIMCGYRMFLTQGAHGIGWFVLSLAIIWIVIHDMLVEID